MLRIPAYHNFDKIKASKASLIEQIQLERMVFMEEKQINISDKILAILCQTGGGYGVGFITFPFFIYYSISQL